MIEIMISIALLTLIFALAIPALGNLLSRNQARSAASQFMDDLRQARYDSRTHSGSIVIFCAIGSAVINDSINCDTGEGFKHGWLWYTGTTLLGKNYAVRDTAITVSARIKFRAELRKGEITLWNSDSETARTEIAIPHDAGGGAIFPSVSFTGRSSRTSEVIFDSTGRTSLKHSFIAIDQ